MKKVMLNRTISVGLFLFAVGLCQAFNPSPVYSEDRAIARLTDFSGTVLIKSKGDWGVQPEKDLPLYSDDKIITRTGIATVTFDDGSVIDIKANSNLLIRETEEKGIAREVGAVRRKIRLIIGKVLFRSGKGSVVSTSLETTTMVCGLRGTAGTLSIDAAGVTYLQFTEGGGDTIGNFISGVAPDVPAELADLNPAQRAAFVAAAAADQARQAAERLAKGEIADPEAALAAAKAAEAAAREAKDAAEEMRDNPDPEIRNDAAVASAAAEAALEAARMAIEKATDAGATVGDSGIDTSGLETIGFDTQRLDDFLNGGDDAAVLGSSYGVFGDYLKQAIDSFTPQGNESDMPPSGDLISPVIDIIAYPAAFNNSGSPSFQFSADERVTCYYRLDNGDMVQAGTSEAGEVSGFEVAGLQEGDHTLDLIVRDDYGNETSETFSWTTDMTAPMVTLAVTPGTTATLMASTTNSEPGAVSYLFVNADTNTVTPPYGFADGTYNINVTATDQAGNSSTYPFSFDLDNMALEGQVFGSGSVISGTSTGAASAVSGIGSGGWKIDLEGNWSGTHSGLLSIASGGKDGDTYWLSQESGSIDMTGEATGTTYFYAANETSITKGQGAFSGTFSSDNTWTGEDTGISLVAEPFDMSGIWVSDSFFYYGMEITDSGSNGYAGLTASGGAAFNYFAMGDYTNSYASSYQGPYVWLAEIGSYDDVTPNLYENHALMGGVWNGGTMRGFLAGLYDTDEVAGILYSSTPGNYYPLNVSGNYGVWKVGGALSPVEIIGLGMDYYIPDECPVESHFLFDDLTYYRGNGLYLSSGAYGITENGESLTNYILTVNEDFHMAFGAWALRLDGSYDPMSSPGSGWALSVGGYEIDGGPRSVFVEIGPGTGGSLWDSNTGEISANVAGSWIDLDKATTGVLGGKLAGTFNADYSAWQSIAMGGLLDTKAFLDMADNNPSALAALDIPCVEVGSVTLTGTGAGNLTYVSMNDVRFFAYSTGASPRVWATADVSGTVSAAGNPAGDTAYMSGSSGTASFSGVQFTMDSYTAGGTWSASVSGSGSVGVNSVSIEGGAAGAAGSSGFTGTASGVSR